MLIFCKIESKSVPLPIVKSIETVIKRQKMVFVCAKIEHPEKLDAVTRRKAEGFPRQLREPVSILHNV
jgi:EAL domain-containing protein (putative c-di-GMP-specific phosphodiesterase class I)